MARDYRKILHDLDIDDLREYARDVASERSDSEIDGLSVEELVAILEEDDCEQFAVLWENAHEDDGDMMHPDETDEEFFEHEAPDKD